MYKIKIINVYNLLKNNKIIHIDTDNIEQEIKNQFFKFGHKIDNIIEYFKIYIDTNHFQEPNGKIYLEVYDEAFIVEWNQNIQ